MQFELLLQNKNQVMEWMVVGALCNLLFLAFRLGLKQALVWKAIGEHCINSHASLINDISVAF